MSHLRFYFDFISPFAYLAWARLAELEAEAECRFQRVPVLFAGLLNAHGQLGPAEIPAKKRWVFRHVARQAERHGIAIAKPAYHPFNPLLPLRLACLDLPRDQRDALIDRLFRAIWSEGLHVSEPEVMTRLLQELELDPPIAMQQAGSEANKTRLRTQTEQAVSAGVFGVPSFAVDGEIFWGFDDMPNLLDTLQGRDPLGPMDPSAIPEPSATRR